MIIKEYFYNIQCDCCGSLADEDMWHNEECRSNIDPEGFFRHLGGKDYCPACYEYDDDDNIVTKDGKVWDEDTETEITNNKK